MVKFGYTILYVSDVSKSIGFYETTFGFTRKFITPENDYGELDAGQTTISFASKELAKSNLKNGFIESDLTQKPFAIELGMVTEMVSEIVALAKENGATILEDPKEKPWGQTVAYIRDIDGFLIEICSPLT
jgi:catechol 2,3-dioxygenase-like lactoylglutathione lyase family enzyme